MTDNVEARSINNELSRTGRALLWGLLGLSPTRIDYSEVLTSREDSLCVN